MTKNVANYPYIFITTTTVSTYLLRKQAAAVEGGNRRKEAETKGTRGYRGRHWTNRETERDRLGGGREREGDHISDKDITGPAMQKKTIKFLDCCDARM